MRKEFCKFIGWGIFPVDYWSNWVAFFVDFYKTDTLILGGLGFVLINLDFCSCVIMDLQLLMVFLTNFCTCSVGSTFKLVIWLADIN